jgi:putative PIN family toxin of toxin-antitoxin system
VRIVIDTNVLVSGIFWGGVPHRLLSAWIAGEMEVCATPQVLSEYCDVIDRLAGRCARQDLAKRWKAYLFEHLTLIAESRPYQGVRDPKDDKFIACALSAGASLLVSGDDDLLTLREVEGVKIVKVSDWHKSHRRYL